MTSGELLKLSDALLSSFVKSVYDIDQEDLLQSRQIDSGSKAVGIGRFLVGIVEQLCLGTTVVGEADFGIFLISDGHLFPFLYGFHGILDCIFDILYYNSL